MDRQLRRMRRTARRLEAGAGGQSCSGCGRATHPLVGEESRVAVIGEAPPGGVVCEVPLLFEAGLRAAVRPRRHRRGRGDDAGERSSHGFEPRCSGARGAAGPGERRVAGSDLASSTTATWSTARVRARAYDARPGAGGCGATTARGCDGRERRSRRGLRRRAGSRGAGASSWSSGRRGPAWWCRAFRARSIPSTTRTRSPRWPSSTTSTPTWWRRWRGPRAASTPRRVAGAGAVGLMQLMPDTADWITGLDSWKGAHEPDLTDPAGQPGTGCLLPGLPAASASTATPRRRWPPTTPGRARWAGGSDAGGGAESFDRRRHPLPRDPRVRASGWSTTGTLYARAIRMRSRRECGRRA